MALTGRFRYRRTRLGGILLQLEHDVRISWPLPRHGEHRQVWRNATNSDLLRPEIRGILEVQEFIQHHPEANYGAPRAAVMRMFSHEPQARPKVVSDSGEKDTA